MKSITTKFFLLALFVSSLAFSQSRVKERDVIGTWKFHIDLNKEIDEVDEEEGSFGRALAKGILKTVDELIKDAEITFEFKKNHILVIKQKSLDEDETIKAEACTWSIDKKGRLVTTSKRGDRLKLNDNNGWMLKRGKLVSVDDNRKVQDNVWLEKVKR
ncbi:hypothetical protein [Pseudotenacibaculum haliotis]|uniref:Lipocalin-like domain-containing protein n=1 Tax=Pseudotenacibaculum haliotis TaxID=1862138 RepID=A0ABW5LYK1_9FLAO